MNKIKRISAFILAVTLVLSVFSSAAPLEAEASTKATICQHGGSATAIGYAGCSYCGGSGRKYFEGPRNDNNKIDGSGYNTKTVDTFTYNGINYYNVTLYYRCQNCGDTGYDCKPYDELVYFTGQTRHSVSAGVYVYDPETDIQCSAARAQGYVPIRWCSYCGPKLAAKNEPYETVATWAQYHLDPEPTKAPEYSYTITAGTGGSISNSSNQSGSYKQGTSIYAQAVANSGYHFSSWSASGISTPSSSSASFSMPAKSVSLTANFAKNTPTPTSKPGITPKPTAPGVVATPTSTPTPKPTATPTPATTVAPTALPTKAIPDFVPQSPPVVVTATPKPTPVIVNNNRGDLVPKRF